MIVAMIVAAASLQTAPPPADASTEADIVIIARRARGVRWDWRVGKTGVVTKCVVTRSSGDAEIDRLGCDATRQCAAQGLRSGRPMRDCILARRRALIEQLAARREGREP